MRRVVAVVSIVIGVGLILEPLVLDLFPRAAAGERVTDRFRATMSSDGLTQLQSNFDTVGAFTDQLTSKAVPAFAQRLGMTPAQFKAYLDSNFPAVATGIKEIPPAAAFVGPVIPQLVAAHDEFAAVDTLPALGLPITSVPWLLIGLGLLLIALALGALRIAGPLPLVAVLAVGVGMIVVPLVISLPGKADDAHDLATLGKVALSQKAADAAAAATKVIDDTMAETKTKMLPTIATRLGMSPAEMDKYVQHDFPDVAAGLRAWPSIRPGAYHLAAIQGQSVDDNVTMGDTPFRALPWLLIVPGIALVLVSAAALLRSRRSGSGSGSS
jgi:hypothetical protein